MAESPEFHRRTSRAASSPPKEYQQRTTTATTTCCRIPKDATISRLGDAPTCAPAPRKPPSCRKLFLGAIMVGFVDLEGILRPATGPSK
ncbi:hypothetical protein ACQ4PT_015497 [Festuca glaucescens]